MSAASASGSKPRRLCASAPTTVPTANAPTPLNAIPSKVATTALRPTRPVMAIYREVGSWMNCATGANSMLIRWSIVIHIKIHHILVRERGWSGRWRRWTGKERAERHHGLVKCVRQRGWSCGFGGGGGRG